MADDALTTLLARADALSRPRTAPPSRLTAPAVDMPTDRPQSAADVRALHPGVYDDLSDAQIEVGLGKHAAPADDGTFKLHGDEPLYGSMARYGAEELKGAAHALNPANLWEGIKALPGAVAKGWTQDIPALVKDPSLLTEAPSAAADFLLHPQDVGGTLAQVVAGETIPPVANAALRHGPTLVGKGMSAAGRGAEALGTSKILKKSTPYGVMGTAMSGHPGLALAEALAPAVLEHGGKALQRGGAALEGLDLSLKGRMPFEREQAAVGDVVDPAAVMREKVANARGDVSAGFSRPVASKLNGLKSKATDISHPTADVVSPGELFPYQRDAIRGLEDARRGASSAGDNAWANDASAQPPSRVFDEGTQSWQEYGPNGWQRVPRSEPPVVERPMTPADYNTDNAFTRAHGDEPGPRMNDLAHTLQQSSAFKGLQDAVRRSNLSPIERFYESDPQARGVGGNFAEGRTTGQFDEGEGGLTDIAAGNYRRNPLPSPTDSRISNIDMPPEADAALADLSPLDRLSRLSQRAKNPTDVQALLDKFGGWGR